MTFQEPGKPKLMSRWQHRRSERTVILSGKGFAEGITCRSQVTTEEPRQKQHRLVTKANKETKGID